jgi:uncharacterized protein YcgI (DUF1989 family)
MSIAEGLKVEAEHHVPARTGIAFRVDAGDHIRIVDLQGEQAADFWAFHENDLSEYLSAPHTRIGLMRLLPRPGECFLTNQRRPIIRVVEDPVGVHENLGGASDVSRSRPRAPSTRAHASAPTPRG